MTTKLDSTTVEYTVPRFEDNVPGPWYVNEDCIICGRWSELALESFRESDDGDHNIVFKQPSTAEELEQAHEALEDCPVESIVFEG